MKRYLVVILLVAGCVLLFGFNLGDLSIPKGDENYYFSSSRRMIREGDWITPRYHHHIRFEKPILYYWIVALFLKLFGTTWAVARMTSVVFGTLTVLLTYLLALRFFTKRVAILSAIILATTFAFFQYSRFAVIDITFLFLVTLSLFFIVKSDRENKPTLLSLSFIPLGLSVLAKGPLGLVVVFLIVLTYIIITKKYRLLKPVSLFLGIILLLIITLPWPLLMYKIHGQAYLSHIWEVETVDKAFGSIFKLQDVDNTGYFLLRYIGYYVPVVLFSFAPWSLLLPFGLSRRLATNKDDGRIFILSWFWVVFLFFTIVSFKHTHYMLLLSPPLAMIVADLFLSKKTLQRLSIVIALITIVFYLSLTGFILPILDNIALKDFSLVIASEIKKDEEVGLASKEFNLKKLGIHLNNLVSTPYQLSGDDLAQYRNATKIGKLTALLESENRIFCLITERDFVNLVPEKLKKHLYILEKAPVWRDFGPKRYLDLILKKKWGSLKEEAYLVSNRRR